MMWFIILHQAVCLPKFLLICLNSFRILLVLIPYLPRLALLNYLMLNVSHFISTTTSLTLSNVGKDHSTLLLPHISHYIWYSCLLVSCCAMRRDVVVLHPIFQLSLTSTHAIHFQTKDNIKYIGKKPSQPQVCLLVTWIKMRKRWGVVAQDLDFCWLTRQIWKSNTVFTGAPLFMCEFQHRLQFRVKKKPKEDIGKNYNQLCAYKYSWM